MKAQEGQSINAGKQRTPEVERLREKRVCISCIGEEWLKARMQESGSVKKCDYCSHKNLETWSLGCISDATRGALERHYEHESSDAAGNPFFTSGEPESLGVTITGFLVLKKSEIAKDICSILEVEASQSESDGTKKPKFDHESAWFKKSDSNFDSIIERMKQVMNIKSERRMFNRELRICFRKILNDAEKLASENGTTLWRKIEPKSKMKIYRSRLFESTDEVKLTLEEPDAKLGPPNSKLASAGRLNPVGIPVFYGSTCPKLTHSEVRPFAGAKIITAAFDIAKDINVLDADVFDNLKPSESYLNPNYKIYLDNVVFFNSIRRWLSHPVMPGDEDLDYLLTQAFAEYIAHEHKPSFDGILFKSAQENSKSETQGKCPECDSGKCEKRNIALFKLSRLVKSINYPPNQKKFRVTEDKKQFLKFTIHGPINDEGVPAKFDPGEEEDILSSMSTLSLDTQNIKVHYVTGLDVITKSNVVSWKEYVDEKSERS